MLIFCPSMVLVQNYHWGKIYFACILQFPSFSNDLFQQIKTKCQRGQSLEVRNLSSYLCDTSIPILTNLRAQPCFRLCA